MIIEVTIGTCYNYTALIEKQSITNVRCQTENSYYKSEKYKSCKWVPISLNLIFHVYFNHYVKFL